MKKLLITVSLVLGLLIVFTTTNAHIFKRKQLRTTFAPPNKVKMPIQHGKFSTGLDEQTFNKAIDDFTAVYNPIVTKHGAKLKINRLWTDDTVNSDTNQVGKTWIINSYGGLARFPGMTYDGFVMVLAHEVNHSLGGAPKYSDSPWASVEGEADYAASLKGFHYMFQNDHNNRAAANKLDVPKTVVQKCSTAYKGDNQQALCERSSMAGLVVSEVLRQLNQDPDPVSFDTPDNSVVNKTNEDHPMAQCRLQTYFAGALCSIDYKIDLSDTNANIGACSYGDGKRPTCWYKSESLRKKL